MEVPSSTSASSLAKFSSNSSLSTIDCDEANNDGYNQDDDSFDLEMGDANTLQLRVKSNGSNTDVNVRVNAQAQVAALKDVVKRRLKAEDRYLRLICKGKLLAPDSAPLSEFAVSSGDVLHAVLAAQGVKGGQQAALARAIPTSITNVASSLTTSLSLNNNSSQRTGVQIGPGGRIIRTQRNADSEDDSDSESDGDADPEPGATIVALPPTGNNVNTSRRRTASSRNNAINARMGFDRLRSSGLSRAQIRVIRTYFSRHVDRHILQHPADHLDEPDLLRRRLLMEDDWMSLQGPTSDFRINLNQTANVTRPTTSILRSNIGSDRDFIFGFCLGFFVGFVMLLWVWAPTIPHKQKIGILTGISFHLAMNVFRQENEEADGLVEDEFDAE